MRISDWSSDVCSSDLAIAGKVTGGALVRPALAQAEPKKGGVLRIGMSVLDISDPAVYDWTEKGNVARQIIEPLVRIGTDNLTRPHLAERWEATDDVSQWRSEEHTSELQSLMLISYAVCSL